MNDAQMLAIIVDELKELSKEQREQGKTLAAQEVNLREHMRRTELAEKSIESLAGSLLPVQKHVDTVEIVLKGFGVIAAVSGFVLLVIQIISGLKNFSF